MIGGAPLRDEGMGFEVEDYTACWIENTTNGPNDMGCEQVVLLGALCVSHHYLLCALVLLFRCAIPRTPP